MGTVRIALTLVVFQTTVQTTRRCTHIFKRNSLSFPSGTISWIRTHKNIGFLSQVRMSVPSHSRKSIRDQNDSAWTWCLRPDNQRFMRQPLVTSCVGLAQGCNLLASAVFFGAYLCSDRLSCESLFGSHDRIRTCTTNTLNVPPTANWATWPWKMVDPVRFELTLHSTSSCWLCQLVYGSIAQTW